MRRETCSRCGADVMWLACADGRQRAFNSMAIISDDAPDEVRWFYHRGRGAVSGATVLVDRSREYLILHSCRRTRIGEGESEGPEAGRLEAGGLIAQSKGEKVEELDLVTGYHFSYHWPSSWAHIVNSTRGLCGARVLDLTSSAEKRRLIGMHVCPDCGRRYRRRLSHSADTHR